MTKLKVKRAYDPPSKTDGYRILVDRLWPRGVTREEAAVDEWAKDLAPSTGLRRWFNHDPGRWKEFVARYRAELDAPDARSVLEHIRKLARTRRVTLIYSARDKEYNNAVALRSIIDAPGPKKK